MNHMPKIVLSLVASLLVAGLVADAHAKKRPKNVASSAARPPDEGAVAADLAGIEFGWTRKQVMDHLRRQVRLSYEEKLKRAPGAIEEHNIRHEMNDAMRRLREGYFEFNGNATGFDHSYLRGEFVHRNQESMLRHRTPQSEDHYFFIEGDHFWKLFRAFQSSSFQGASFSDFCAALESRYGRGKWKEGAVGPDDQHGRWLEWESRKYRVRAIDNSTFYGFYSIVFEDMDVVRRLDHVRPKQGPKGPKRHALVDSVTDDVESVIIKDDHADVADRITGQQAAPPTNNQRTR
jgi:hypothetical protein